MRERSKKGSKRRRWNIQRVIIVRNIMQYIARYIIEMCGIGTLIETLERNDEFRMRNIVRDMEEKRNAKYNEDDAELSRIVEFWRKIMF